MSTRSRIKERQKRLLDVAHLLRQVPEGATTFGPKGEDDKYEIMHNGRPTGFFISDTLYRAVTNQALPEAPKILPDRIEVYDLKPSDLETEFRPMYEYVEAVAIYIMMMFDVSANGVEVEVKRTAQDTVQWTIRKAEDDGDDHGEATPPIGS